MLVIDCVCIVWYLDKTLLLKWSVTYWCFEIIAKGTITHTYHWQSLAIHSMCSHFIVPYTHQGKKSWCCVHWIYSVTNQMLASRQQVSMQIKPKSLRITLLSMHNQFARYKGTGQLSPGREIKCLAVTPTPTEHMLYKNMVIFPLNIFIFTVVTGYLMHDSFAVEQLA